MGRKMENATLKTSATLALLVSWSALAQTTIEFDATSGGITTPFIITNGYIYQPLQTDVAKGGRAVFSFTLTNAGAFVVQARVDAPGSQTNSFYVNIDGEPKDATMLWDIPITTGFTPKVVSWRGNSPGSKGPLSREVFTLSSGNHELIIRGNTANTKLAHILIGRVPSPPRNPRIVTGP